MSLTQCLTSGIHSLSFGLLLGTWVTSPAPPSATHTACFLSLGRLHSTAGAVLSSHPTVPACPKCWSLLLQLNCIFTIVFLRLSSWCKASTSLHHPFSPDASIATLYIPSPMASPILSQCQASADLHDPLHAFKISTS